MKATPLVVTYRALLKSLSITIDKNFRLLYMDKDVKTIFIPRPTVSFQSARKLNSYLAKEKLHPLWRTVGSYKCNSKRYQVCNKITETNSFICSNGQTTFKINHRFDCNEKCLI